MRHFNGNNTESIKIDKSPEIVTKEEKNPKLLESFSKDLKDLKNKYKVEFEPSITFPQYNILPEEIRLALIILQKHEAKLAIGITKEEIRPPVKI